MEVMSKKSKQQGTLQSVQERLFTEYTFTLVAVAVICQSALALHAPASQVANITSLLTIGLGVALVIMLSLKTSKSRQLLVLGVSLFTWMAMLIFYIPLTSPYYGVNFLIVLLAARSLDARITLLTGGLLVVAVEAGVFRRVQNYGDFSLLIEPALQVGLLVLVTLVTATIIVRAEQQDNPAHARLVLLERERLQALINSMADAVITTDRSGFVVLYNGAALELLDINLSLEGKPLGNYVKLIDKKGNPVDIFELAKASRTYYVSRDLSLSLTDNEVIKLYLSISPVRIGYESGGAHGYVILLRDITKEKSLEEERDEFISVVSHELRTPIAIAEGDISNAQLLTKKGADMEKVAKTLQQAHDQVVFLAAMINDLSTLSRAERGKLEVSPEELDPNEILKSLTDNYTKEATDKGLELIVQSDSNAPRFVSSKLYVQEILQNFVTNSIKYTASGSVTVTAKPHEKGIVFTVSDTGIGISKADIKHVFEKFFRSEDYRTRETSGTGLGLYVTKKLANLIGATLEVESELNKGTTFSIIIPSVKGSAATQTQVSQPTSMPAAPAQDSSTDVSTLPPNL